MEVLILSKTKYGSTQVCVGGINIKNNEFIRLLQPNGYYQPINTPLNIGDIWDIDYTKSNHIDEPHNEDVFVNNFKFIKKVYKLESYIKTLNVPIWKDSIANIYDRKLLWTYGGKGYLSANVKNYPVHSVGFWVSDVDLIYNGKDYVYSNNGVTKQVVYKGNLQPIAKIPKGKLIRISLAKWWKPEDSDIEARCYLQLSGWYEDQVEPIQKMESKQQLASKPIVRPHIATKSYEPPKHQAPNTTQQSKNTSGSCYIATLCYDDFYADEVCSFRDFRDKSLSKSKLGRQFITKYYRHAPKLTAKLENYKTLNKAIKHIILNPLLIIIKSLNLDEN
jgi:hypothetical protein